MAKPAVGVLSGVPRLIHVLSSKLPEINFINICSGTKEKLESSNVKVIIADFDLLANILYSIPQSISWVQGTWAGADKLLAKYDCDKELHYTVTRFTGPHFGTMMAEYVISNLVSLQRNFYTTRKNQEAQIWNCDGNIADYRVIADMKIGVLGIGAIGKHVASALKLLGAAQIWGLVSKLPEKQEPFIDFYRNTSEVKELLENCDVIVNILPHTVKTTGLLNKENLSACKGSVFINVGRGSIVSESDLVAALNKKYLSIAILDVFNEEPLSKSSSLWKMEQVIITPHVAAITRAQDVAKVFADNFARWKQGRPLNYTINFAEGY